MTADLAHVIDALGVELSSRQREQLALFADALATSAHNLTSAADRGQLYSRHIAESLAFGKLLDQRGLLDDGSRVLDVGAGGGLPGIPLRIAWPHIRLALLDSVGKKCRFLEDVARRLDLEAVSVLEGRAEDYGRHPEHRERYDLVVARAVAPLPVLVEYALPFLRTGGRLAAVKGSAAGSEIAAASRAISELNAGLLEAAPLSSPQAQPQTVVLLQKLAPTPDRYPRRPGIPSKRPL